MKKMKITARVIIPLNQEVNIFLMIAHNPRFNQCNLWFFHHRNHLYLPLLFYLNLRFFVISFLIVFLFSFDQLFKESKCKECEEPRASDGFKCAAGQMHVPCWHCGKLMPLRNDPALK